MTNLRLSFMVVGIVVPVAVWAGCGSESGTDDLVTPADDGGADGSTTSPDGGSPADSGTNTNGDAGPPGTITADGGQNPADAGPGGNTTQLACGGATCAIPGQSCCVQQLQGQNNTLAYFCVVGAQCPAPDGGNNGDVTALGCTSGANCAAGEVCCVSQNNGVTASKCQATACGGGGGGGDFAQLCDKNAGDAGCPQGVQCSSNNINDWNLPPTFATCGGKGN